MTTERSRGPPPDRASARPTSVRSPERPPPGSAGAAPPRRRGETVGYFSSLAFRLTAAYLTFGLVILASAAGLSFAVGRSAIERMTTSSLVAVAAEKEAALAHWFNEKRSEIHLMANIPALIEIVPALVAAEASGAEAVRARDRIGVSMKLWVESGRKFHSIFLMHPETGEVIAASDRQDVGKFRENRKYFIEGKNQPYVQDPTYSVSERGPSYVFSAPMKSPNGRLLAVLAARGRHADVDEIVRHRPDWFASGDSFIVNTAMFFVTQPRFIDDDATFRYATTSDSIRDCLRGNPGVTQTTDYRGVAVLKATRFLPDRGLCLIAKIDQAEAFAPIDTIGRYLLFVFVGALALACLFAFFLARTVTRPVRHLQAGALRLGRGDHGVRLAEARSDEIGMLARDFNRMASALDDEAAKREQAERENAETVARLRSLAENLPGVIFRMVQAKDGVARYPYVSGGALAFLGIEAETLMRDGAAIFASMHPDDRRGYSEALRRSAQALTAVDIEVRFLPGGQEMHWVKIASMPRRLEGGEVEWNGLALDITALRNAEAKLRQSQKMEAVGQLTGGIAHDFNNLLTVILGSAESLEELQAVDARLKRPIEMVKLAARRAADLTARLLAFSRQQPLQPRLVELNGLLEKMLKLLTRTLGEHIEIELVPGAGLWRVTVDPAQLESAILNLALNARDAMPEGGKLTIETANVELDRNYSDWNEEVSPGAYAMIYIVDTGSGMTPEVLARAFDPFFTTKEVDKGTGLGLSMVYGFVKQSNGHIKLYSEVGHGTAIRLYLPRAAEAVAQAPAPADRAEPARGNETILLVEDDDLVREQVEKMMRSLGYAIRTARNGPEALEVLRGADPLDMVFTDVVMPGGMNGRQLAKEAQRLRPGLKVLCSSGYAEKAFAVPGVPEPGIDFLPKPYDRGVLAATLRAILDRARTAA